MADPLSFAQAPTVVDTISIPKPTPLVQSNLPVERMSFAPSDPDNLCKFSDQECGMACPRDLIKLGDQTQEQLNDLQEVKLGNSLAFSCINKVQAKKNKFKFVIHYICDSSS